MKKCWEYCQQASPIVLGKVARSTAVGSPERVSKMKVLAGDWSLELCEFGDGKSGQAPQGLVLQAREMICPALAQRAARWQQTGFPLSCLLRTPFGQSGLPPRSLGRRKLCQAFGLYRASLGYLFRCKPWAHPATGGCLRSNHIPRRRIGRLRWSLGPNRPVDRRVTEEAVV